MKSFLKTKCDLSFNPDDLTEYRQHQDPLTVVPPSSFDSPLLTLNGKEYKSVSIKIQTNFLLVEERDIKVNIINLQLSRTTPKQVQLKQPDFCLFVNFKKQSEAREFVKACGCFPVHSGIWLDYVKLKKLGEGGFSKVFLAREIGGVCGLFAVKRIKKANLDTKAFSYFQTELFTLRNIIHPNSLKLFRVYEDDFYFFLVTEYLDGGTLTRRLKARRAEESLCVTVVTALLKVIVELNKYSLIHRDIKPANIMFTFDEEGRETVKLIDFGLCADFTDHSETTPLKDKSGTVCYLAPELIGWDLLNKHYGKQVDIFSIGMILYEM